MIDDDRHHDRDDREERREHERRARAARRGRRAAPRAGRPGRRCRSPLSSASASKPVRCTGAPADRDAARARRAPPSRRPGSRRTPSRGRAAGRRSRRSCGRRRRRRRGRRSRRTRRSARRAARAARRASTCAQVGAHAGRVDGLARGSVTTGTSGARVAAGAAVVLGDLDVGLPALLVGHRELLRRARPMAGPAAAMPAIVRTIQKMTTVRLWARTQRVSEDTALPPGLRERRIVPRRNNLYHE